MILLIIRMNVLAEKRMELSQAIVSLSGSIRMEKGCRRCDFCRSIDNENLLFLLEEWDTQANLVTHLKSEHFMVFRGAMNLLEKPFEMIFHTVFQPEGMEEFYKKSNAKNQAEGRFYQMEGKLKEIAGELSDNPKLEVEGTGEKIAGNKK